MKMNKCNYWLVFIFLNCFNYSFAQSIQDLENNLKKTTNWEKQVELCIQLSDTLNWLGEDLNLSKKYASQALEICETRDCGDHQALAIGYLAEIGINQGDYTYIDSLVLPLLQKDNFQNPLTKAYLHEVVGGYYMVNGYGDKAIEQLTIAKSIVLKNAPTSKRLTNAYIYLAFSHNINSVNDSSILFMQKAIEQARANNDTIVIVENLSNLNTLYANDGKQKEALKVLLEAKEIVENSEIAKDQVFNIYDNLIYLYIQNKDYTKAEKELKKIIPQYRAKEGNQTSKASTMWSFYMSLSKIMGYTNRYREGMEYVDSAYVYAAYLNEFSVLITDLRRAGMNIKLQNYEISTTELQKLLQKIEAYGQVDAFNAALIGLFADLHLNSSIKPNRKAVKALEPMIERIITKNKGQYNTDLLDAQRLSTVLAIYKKDSKNALKSMQSVLEIRDTLQSIEKQKVTNELFVQYETEKKNKELAINKLELEKQNTLKNSLIAGIIVLALLAGILFLFFQQKRQYATQLEAEVAERTADLQKVNQALLMSNEELERYTYIASHDLKEPLRNIVSFVGMIKRRKMVEGGDAATYFSYIEEGAIQMNNIIKDVLEFSALRKLSALQQNVSVTQVIENVKIALASEIDARKTIIELYKLPTTIISDEGMLFMIFKNLIENAIKFNESVVPFIKIRYSETEQNHIFEVIDNGIGIEEEYHERVFEMFKRLHDRSKYKGSGIGLAICKRTVSYLKGEITVASNESEGVTFIIKLPKVSL